MSLRGVMTSARFGVMTPTAPELDEYERSVLVHFEVTPPAPESFDAVAALRRVIAEVSDWPAADFWHRDAINAAIRGDEEPS